MKIEVRTSFLEAGYCTVDLVSILPFDDAFVLGYFDDFHISSVSVMMLQLLYDDDK